MLTNIIGYAASILIIVSIAFKTTTFRGTVIMRILNAIGSLFFIIYAVIIRVYPTVIANGAAFVINIVYLIIEIISHNKQMRDRVNKNTENINT